MYSVANYPSIHLSICPSVVTSIHPLVNFYLCQLITGYRMIFLIVMNMRFSHLGVLQKRFSLLSQSYGLFYPNEAHQTIVRH